MRKKHVPVRTCVACGESGAKRELMRVVRRPDGAIAIDPTGKQPGRGAYIHRSSACWRKALSGTRLAHVLKASPAADEQRTLQDQLRLLELEEHLAVDAVSAGAVGDRGEQSKTV